MYDTRWPRPGPAMLAVAVLLGLVVGGAFGLISRPGKAGAATGGTASGTQETTTTTPSTSFWTVVVGSPETLDQARSIQSRVEAKGIEAFIITKQDYPILATPYAVCSGQFETKRQQLAHFDDLKGRGVNAYPYPNKLSKQQGG